VLDRLKNYFQEQIAPEAAALDPDHRLQIATCALLLEAAHADDDFDDEERVLIRSLLQERFALSEAQARELIDLSEQQRQESTDLYQFTRLISARFDRRQKLVILEQLWRVVYSDGRLEAHEDALLHKFANLFGLRHDELIAVKLKVKREAGAGA
jgi:uncharacterized tellurite resistance protein B-like protein